MLGVKTAVRIGTCGTIQSNIALGDTLLVTGSHSSHDIFSREFPGASFSALPDFDLTMRLYQTATRIHGESSVHAGAALCSETFYEDSFDLYRKFATYQTLCVEMESYPLFVLGAKYGMKTAVMLTVSDVIFESTRADKAVIAESVDKNIRSVLDTLSMI